MQSSHFNTHYDLIIVGGGMVGASLALSLRNTALNVLLVEKNPIDTDSQPSFDERTVALTRSAELIFERLRLWQTIKQQSPQACCITNIHISNKGHFGITHLNAEQIDQPTLGHVIPTRVIGSVLWQGLNAINTEQTDDPLQLDIACPATLDAIIEHEDSIQVQLHDNGSCHNVTTSLLIIADGGRSQIAQTLGYELQHQPYEQSAVLSFLTIADHPKHDPGRAFERFTEHGPIALLPNGKHRYALVWTTPNDQLKARLKLDETEFLTQLQHEFGYRAGIFTTASKRLSYPLGRVSANRYIGHRSLLIGNAAHTVHPVAGQGYNLSLRDVTDLAIRISNTIKTTPDGLSTTASVMQLLNDYQATRRREAERVLSFTHRLIETFSDTTLPTTLGRNTVLALIETCPAIKRWLLTRTTGLSSTNRRLYAQDI